METPTQAHHASGAHAKSSASDTISKRILIWILIILSVLAIGAMAMKIYLIRPASHDVNSKEYQALFLTNGQVYFGKLTGLDSGYVKLTDIYYLQTQTAQPASGSNAAAAAQQSLSLAKLGSELHGPEDAMYVAKSQVLFWENLKDSGKVVQAIKSYQATKK